MSESGKAEKGERSGIGRGQDFEGSHPDYHSRLPL